MPKNVSRLVAVLMLFAGACSSPSDNNGNDSSNDPDMGGVNNTADMPFLDVNNMTGDVSTTGCQATGCGSDQVCNMQTGVCVDCLTNAECGANGSCDPVSNKCSCDAGFHLCDGSCSANNSVDSCGTSCDACPSDPNGTSTCDGSACGITCTAPLVLDAATNSCVGCSGNNDCMGAGASVCGTSGACESCTGAPGCAHIAGKPICDGGSCVECSASEDSACQGNSCDSFTGTCTATAKASVDQCGPCLADSECMTGHACVPMNFAGDARSGGFCLPIDNGGCTGQLYFSVPRTSLSGVAANYCTLNEALTTCEAIGDYGAPCADASDCGAVGLDDGVCEPIDFDAAGCSFPCDDSAQCPLISVMGCANGNGNFWCGAY